jgi:hypothetical protein
MNTFTFKVLTIILIMLKHFSTGLASCNEAAQPRTCGFFVRKISILRIMTDWAEHSKEWPVASPVRQLCSICHPMIGVIWWRVYNLSLEKQS